MCSFISEFEAVIAADLSGSWKSSSPRGFCNGQGCCQSVLGAGWPKEKYPETPIEKGEGSVLNWSHLWCSVDGDVGHHPAGEGRCSWHC